MILKASVYIARVAYVLNGLPEDEIAALLGTILHRLWKHPALSGKQLGNQRPTTYDDQSVQDLIDKVEGLVGTPWIRAMEKEFTKHGFKTKQTARAYIQAGHQVYMEFRMPELKSFIDNANVAHRASVEHPNLLVGATGQDLLNTIDNFFQSQQKTVSFVIKCTRKRVEWFFKEVHFFVDVDFNSPVPVVTPVTIPLKSRFRGVGNVHPTAADFIFYRRHAAV